MAIGKLKTVVLDAPDIARLSAFYSELAGWTRGTPTTSGSR